MARFGLATLVLVALLGAGAAAAADRIPGPLIWSAPWDVDPSGADGLRLACPSARLCVGVNWGGELLSTTNPAGGPAAWKVGRLSDAALRGVDCATESVCVAFDNDGYLYVSTDPASGHAWTRAKVAGPGFHPVACPSPSLCAAGNGQDLLVSTTPTDPASWQTVSIASEPCPQSVCSDPYPVMRTIACPDAALCVAGDSFGRLIASSAPSDASSWHLVYQDPTQTPVPTLGGEQSGIEAVSCAGRDTCVAADTDGNVATSADPASTSWTLSKVTILDELAAPAYAFVGLSCPAALRCVAVANYRQLAAVSDDPAAGGSSYSGTPLGELATDVACPTEVFCVAGGSGRVSVGTAPWLTPALLARGLRGQLAPTLSLRVGSLVPGSLTVTWRAGGALVAWGARTFHRAGAGRLALTLTHFGARLRALHPRIHLQATAVLTVAGHEPIRASRRLRPRWSRSRSRSRSRARGRRSSSTSSTSPTMRSSATTTSSTGG